MLQEVNVCILYFLSERLNLPMEAVGIPHQLIAIAVTVGDAVVFPNTLSIVVSILLWRAYLIAGWPMDHLFTFSLCYGSVGHWIAFFCFLARFEGRIFLLFHPMICHSLFHMSACVHLCLVCALLS